MPKQTPLLGVYLAKNPVLATLLFLLDLFTFPCKLFLKRKPRNSTLPQKILLSNLGHLGDVVIATSVLPVLKAAFPQTKIGFLVSSSSAEVVSKHPLVDQVHLLDHWKTNREKLGFFQKLKKYYRMRKQALKEIKQEKYDLAIDLYFYFPNSIPLLWKAKIPRRLGFVSGGFKNLLTDAIFFKNKNQYASEYYLELLKEIPISAAFLSKLSVCLKEPLIEDKRLLPLEFEKKGYLIMHMGAGADLKKWPEERWKKLAGHLIEKGFFLAFTGKGNQEMASIFNITKNFSQAANLCNQLNFDELQFVVQNAHGVVCSDSLVAHLAGAYNVPSVILFTGLNNHHHWTPPVAFSQPLIKKMDCFPCFKRKGCLEMSCLKDITVEEVEESLEIILKQEKSFSKDQPELKLGSLKKSIFIKY